VANISFLLHKRKEKEEHPTAFFLFFFLIAPQQGQSNEKQIAMRCHATPLHSVFSLLLSLAQSL